MVAHWQAGIRSGAFARLMFVGAYAQTSKGLPE